MSIAFDTIPSNINVPLFHAEVRPAQAPFEGGARMLIIGQKFSYLNSPFGAAALNRVYSLSGDNVVELFGPGSIVQSMYQFARAQAPLLDINAVAIDDPVGGVVADATLHVAGAPAASRSGLLALVIAGKSVAINVAPTDTQAIVCAKLKIAINRASGLPCYAIAHKSLYPAAGGTTDPNKLRLLFKHKGVIGNSIRISSDLYNNRLTLAEKLINITQFANGAGVPSLGPGLAGADDRPYSVFVNPYDSPGPMGTMTGYLDHIAGRWSTYQQLFGHAVTCHDASYANQIPFGGAFNDPHQTCLAVEGPLQPTWEWAAAFGSVMALHMIDPPEMSRPLQGLPLRGIRAPLGTNRFDIAERNALHEAGLATCDIGSDGTVRINRAVTMRKTNSWGVVDPSWRDAETLFQCAYVVNAMKAAVTGIFPRAALTDRDTNIIGFASPETIRDVIVHEYKRLEGLGLVENSRLFADGLIVERDTINATRVNAYLPIDVVNQLRVFAALVESHLQLRDSFVAAQNETDNVPVEA